MGVLLYFMLYGYHPFEGSNDSEVVQKILKDDPKFPTNVKVSGTCKALIKGMLEKNQHIRIELTDPLFEKWYRGEEYFHFLNF